MIRILLCTCLCFAVSFAQYKKGTIDTHGGKKDQLFDKKSSFSQQSGFSLHQSLGKKEKKKTPKNKPSKTK